MRREEFINFCQAIDAGEERYVENLVTRKSGRVISCSGDRFDVDVAEKQESWSSEDCESTTGSSAYREPSH